MFWWPAASFGWRRDGRRLDQGLGPNVLGHEIGVLPEAIAGPLDLDDDGVVKKPVQEGGCDHGVTKNLAPFCKTAVRGEDHGALLVTGVDELEEQVATARNDRQVA